ncbi:MAG: phage Gp19/Gp15/Gp42 family protein [Lachnospira sp.]
MKEFATVEDVEKIWRTLTDTERTRAMELLPVISDNLRHEALKVKKDLDKMSAESEVYQNVVKSVTVDILGRMLLADTTSEPMSQMTQSALGYSVTGTYLIPGGGLFIKKSELARLGLRRQRIGAIKLNGNDTWNSSNST